MIEKAILFTRIYNQIFTQISSAKKANSKIIIYIEISWFLNLRKC